MKPLVSILIPAYKAQEWVADSLTSALEQTWPNKEIILVDDGSTDETLSIARQFASKSVCVVTQPHGGAAAARNRALALSQGDYIQWLDADDLLAADKIAKQMAEVEGCLSKRTLLSCPWGRFMYRPNRAQFLPTSLWADLAPVEWLARKMEENVFIQTASWLASRELTEAVGPWDTRLQVDDDGEYFSRVVLASDRVKFVPDAKAFWRVSGRSGLSFIGTNNGKVDSQFRSIELQIARIRALADDERVRAACLRYLQNFLIFVYPERPDLFKEAEELAATLGGNAEVPRLSWKYAAVKSLFGWTVAKRAWTYLPVFKQGVKMFSDKTLFQLEGFVRTQERPVSNVQHLKLP